MPSRYFICDGEKLFDSRNILGELISIPKVGDEYVYKERHSKKEVCTGKKIEEIRLGSGGKDADYYLNLDDKSIVKIFLM